MVASLTHKKNHVINGYKWYVHDTQLARSSSSIHIDKYIDMNSVTNQY